MPFNKTMLEVDASGSVTKKISKGLSSGKIDMTEPRLFMVLAAGHGNRLRSSLPKVMHSIWGEPSLKRVIKAAEVGLDTKNQVIVVGKKADEVIEYVGGAANRLYAYQHELNGTGHAVQEGLKCILENYDGVLYTLPGDMGLLDKGVLERFRIAFERTRPAMMILTGMYRGEEEKNYYGRIVSVPAYDRNGVKTDQRDVGKVIAIVQYQDLKKMSPMEEKLFCYKGREYSFKVGDLLASRKFDAGVFAFSLRALRKYIYKLGRNNVQNEIYLTDLVMLYNENNLDVEHVIEHEVEVLLGFNDKTVWRKMEEIFRRRYYERLKNIIDIEDESRFYIHEKVVCWIEREDAERGPLDIVLGAGVAIGEDVQLARGVKLGQNVSLTGNVVLGENVHMGASVVISNFLDQKIVIEKNVSLGGNSFIKGNVIIEAETQISESVNITGSTEYPTLIGKRTVIIGSCYIFGCKIDMGCHIESCILIKKNVCARKVNGKILPIKYIIPKPVGAEHIHDL